MVSRFESAIVATLVVAALSGCVATATTPSATPTQPYPYRTAVSGANGPGTAPGPGTYPPVPATHPHVQIQCPLISAVHYDPQTIAPDDVDSAYVCTTRPYFEAPDGTPQIEELVDRIAADDIPALLDAYAVPDREPGGPCTFEFRDPMIVWLHWGDGAITAVYAPRDGCAQPTDASTQVYSELELHRLLVAREKLRTK